MRVAGDHRLKQGLKALVIRGKKLNKRIRDVWREEKAMRRMASITIMLGVLLAAYGCANYGAIKPADNKMSIETLVKNWKDYDVSWTGLSLAEPTALMFDPKGDGKKLVGDIWHPVESKESLLDFISWLKTNQAYYPFVWRILGPDGQFYGYLYSGWSRAVVKPIDETRVWVYGIPPTLRGEDRSLMFKD